MLLYMSLRVTTNQKSVIDVQQKRKEPKYNTKDGYQIIREKNKKKQKNNQKTIKKGNKYIFINNYFKCKQTEHSNKRHRVAEWMQKQDRYIC